MMKGDIAPLDHDAVVNDKEAKAAREFTETIADRGTSDCLPVGLDKQNTVLREVARSFVKATALPHVADRRHRFGWGHDALRSHCDLLWHQHALTANSG
jgi:hypothetical protein